MPVNGESRNSPSATRQKSWRLVPSPLVKCDSDGAVDSTYPARNVSHAFDARSYGSAGMTYATAAATATSATAPIARDATRDTRGASSTRESTSAYTTPNAKTPTNDSEI